MSPGVQHDTNTENVISTVGRYLWNVFRDSSHTLGMNSYALEFVM